LNQLLKTAKEKKEESRTKGWKFRTPNGTTMVVRDVFEKIVNWVEKFKAVVDTAIQFDPLYAALPWAAVRFLLQVGINDIQTFGVLAERLERISYLITRHIVLEYVYRMTKSTSEPFEELMTRLYADILNFLARAVRYFKDSTASE
jgi:hypothetical protein